MGVKSERPHEPLEDHREGFHDLREHEAWRRAPRKSRARTAAFIRIGILVLLVCAGDAPSSAYAQFCDSCEVEVGAGGTYHYWGKTGSLVLPVSVNWSEGRYEFGIFRFTDQQLLPFPGTHRERLM